MIMTPQGTTQHHPADSEGAYRPEHSLTYDVLAERELRKLEDVGSATTLPPAYVAARGFAALTYAVLALHETTDSTSTDIANAISDVSENVTNASWNLRVMTVRFWRPRLPWRGCR
jgi:hypothetical protein